MSNPDPLQRADRAPNFSTRDNSTAADRRTPDQNSVNELWEGANASPQREVPQSLEWAPGQMATPSFLKAPLPIDYHESAAGDEVHALDRDAYGYCFTPKATFRVSNSPEVETSEQNDQGNKDYNYPLFHKEE